MRKREHKGIFYAIAVGMILTVGLAGCTKTGSSVTVSSVSYITVMHMAPYAPAMDIYLNGSLSSASGGIVPGSYSQQYSSVKPGVYDIQFKKTGTDSLLAEIPSSSYDTSSFYTLILYNTSASSPAQAVKIQDDFSTISAVSANYRFFNMSPDEPRVDLYFNNTAVQSSRATADNVVNTTYNSFQAATPAPYNLQVKVAGTDSVIAYLNNVSLQAGGVYTLFLSGVKSGNSNTHQINVLPASY
jgi:hypothetical protein